MGRKIGILTYFWGCNPGTFLQAFSMQEALARRFPGDRVEVVDLKHRRFLFRPDRYDPWLPSLIEHYRRHRIYRSTREHLQMSPTGLVTDEYDKAAAFIENQRYDLVVVGADVILYMMPNYVRHGTPPIYWLPPTMACKKVCCAASARELEVDSLDAAMRRKLTESIRAFDLVGVRDDVTYELMEDLGLRGDPRLAMVPDSTFTFDIDPDLAKAALLRYGVDVGAPTVVVNMPRRPLCDGLVRYYKDKGFQVVSLLAGMGPVDRHVSAASPFEWAGIPRYGNLVLTNRFHGTLFSLRNGTPVVSMQKGSRRHCTAKGLSKLYTLQRQFGGEKTNFINLDTFTDLEAATKIADVAMASFDAGMVEQTCARMRRQFEAFLDRIAALFQA